MGTNRSRLPRHLGALEADGRPLEALGPEDNILNIVDQTYYAYLRKYAKRAGLGFSR